MRCYLSIALLSVAALAGCTRPIAKGAIIDQYRKAECIPVRLSLGGPATRTWDYMFITPEGTALRISGSYRIQVTYTPNGKDDIATDARDYVYPTDIRFDRKNEQLYVKTSGIAATGGHETWLFEYDLNKQQTIARALVDPSVLPPECPVSNSN
jgi:hypothetical protein